MLRGERQVYRQGTAGDTRVGCFCPMGVGFAYVSDPDTEYLDGGYIHIGIPAGGVKGDTWGLMTEEQQLKMREEVFPQLVEREADLDPMTQVVLHQRPLIRRDGDRILLVAQDGSAEDRHVATWTVVKAKGASAGVPDVRISFLKDASPGLTPRSNAFDSPSIRGMSSITHPEESYAYPVDREESCATTAPRYARDESGSSAVLLRERSAPPAPMSPLLEDDENIAVTPVAIPTRDELLPPGEVGAGEPNAAAHDLPPSGAAPDGAMLDATVTNLAGGPAERKRRLFSSAPPASASQDDIDTGGLDTLLQVMEEDHDASGVDVTPMRSLRSLFTEESEAVTLATQASEVPQVQPSPPGPGVLRSGLQAHSGMGTLAEVLEEQRDESAGAAHTANPTRGESQGSEGYDPGPLRVMDSLLSRRRTSVHRPTLITPEERVIDSSTGVVSPLSPTRGGGSRGRLSGARTPFADAPPPLDAPRRGSVDSARSLHDSQRDSASSEASRCVSRERIVDPHVPLWLSSYILNCITFANVDEERPKDGVRTVKLQISDPNNASKPGKTTFSVEVLPPVMLLPGSKEVLAIPNSEVAIFPKALVNITEKNPVTRGYLEAVIVPTPPEGEVQIFFSGKIGLTVKDGVLWEGQKAVGKLETTPTSVCLEFNGPVFKDPVQKFAKGIMLLAEDNAQGREYNVRITLNDAQHDPNTYDMKVTVIVTKEERRGKKGTPLGGGSRR